MLFHNAFGFINSISCYFAPVKKFLAVGAVLLAIVAAVWFIRHDSFTEPHPVKYTPPVFTDTIAKDVNKFYDQFDAFFTDRNLHGGFNGSVLIAKNGKCVFEKCYGYCDYRSKDLISDTNSFQLASVSKTFTATAVLWCVEHHLLSLDDSLQKFYPMLPYKGVRIKDMLSHRSGLPNYLYFCNNKCNRGEYLNNEQVIAIMAHDKPAAYARVNKKFAYCNTNYMLLASIVEKVVSKKFNAFMSETFFKPLDMTHTFIYDHSNALERKIAVSYNSRWQMQNDDCFDGVVGDKGVYSTVSDMFKWDKAFYDGKLLSQEMMKEAYAPKSFEHPGKRNYGYGWRLLQQPDGNYLVYHNGWWHGNNTVFYRYIQDTTAIIILSNRYNKSVYHVQPLFDILYRNKNRNGDFEEEQ